MLTENELQERIEVFKESAPDNEFLRGLLVGLKMANKFLKDNDDEFRKGLLAGLEMANGGLTGFWDSWKELERKSKFNKEFFGGDDAKN